MFEKKSKRERKEKASNADDAAAAENKQTHTKKYKHWCWCSIGGEISPATTTFAVVNQISPSFFQQTTPTLSFVGERGEWNGGFLSLSSFFLFFCFDCRKFMHNHRHRHWEGCVFVHSSLLLSACHKFFSPTVLILCSERCDAHTLDIWHVKEERDYYCLPSFLLLFYGKKKESLRLLRHEIFIWLIITTSQHWGEKSVVGSKVRNINSSVFAQKQQQFGYYSYTVAILSLLKLKCAPFSPGFDLRLFPFPSSPSFPGQEVNIMANKKFNIFSITHAESELFSLYVLFAGKRNKLLEPGHLKCWGKESKGKKLYWICFSRRWNWSFWYFFLFSVFVCLS